MAFVLLALAGGIAVFSQDVGKPSEAPPKGFPFPAVSLPRFAAGTPNFTTGDFGPGAVLVNFFSSWCGPCQVEHPLLMELKTITPIIGINYMDDPEKARSFLKKLGNPYSDIAVDQQGDMGAILGIDSVPRTILVVDGRIVYAHSGRLKREDIDSGLMPLLKQYRKLSGLQAS